MRNILTLNKIARRGLDVLKERGFHAGDDCPQPEGILLRSHLLSAEAIPDSVAAIARAGAGVNNIPVAACTARGIPVFNAPGANANAVKELVLAGLLLSSRGILPGIRYVESLAAIADGEILERQIEAEKNRFKGVNLAGRVLGIIGLGAIGARVADIALQLGMRVLGYDPALSVDAAWRLPREVERRESLRHMVRDADYISLHVPALDSTRALISEELLAACKPGARLLNFSRRDVVDPSSVVTALERGILSCYVTDFPYPELISREDVILMPHIGASTTEAEENSAIMAAEELCDFLISGNISNAVNYPSISLERRGCYRLAVSNRNVPKKLNAILSVLADAELNVVDMLNRSRDDIAYSLIDLDEVPGEQQLLHIKALEGVIRVRAIPAEDSR